MNFAAAWLAAQSQEWCMEAQAFEALFLALDLAHSSGLDLAAFTPQAPDPAAARGYELGADGTAHIPLTGLMLKSVPSFLKYFGVEATSTPELARAFLRARADPAVKAAELHVDSPGGSVAAVQSAAEAYRLLGESKPTKTVVHDQMASASLWVGAQGRTIEVSGPTDKIGSIGVLSVVRDSSRAAEASGTKVHVVKSGPIKGTGTPGAPVTEAQLSAIQRTVDGMAAMFVGAIAQGRRMPTEAAAKLATGEEWLAHEALAVGLVDMVRHGHGGSPMHGSSLSAEAATAEHILIPEVAIATAEPASADRSSTMLTEAEIAALQAQLATATAKSTRLEQEAAIRESAAETQRFARRTDLVARGVADGRILPPQRAMFDAYSGSEDQLAAMIASMPVQISPTVLGATPRPQETGTAPQLNAQDRAVCAAFGLPENVYIAANGIDAQGNERPPKPSMDGAVMVERNGVRTRVELGKALGLTDDFRASWGELTKETADAGGRA